MLRAFVARIRDDGNVLRQLDDGGDLIAKDIMYHRSCYQAYIISQRNIAVVLESQLALETQPTYSAAFSKLIKHLENSIVDHPEIPHLLSSLCALYKEYLLEEDEALASSHISLDDHVFL